MSYIKAYFKSAFNLLLLVAVWFFMVSLITHPLANYLFGIVLVGALAGPIGLYINRKENAK